MKVKLKQIFEEIFKNKKLAEIIYDKYNFKISTNYNDIVCNNPLDIQLDINEKQYMNNYISQYNNDNLEVDILCFEPIFDIIMNNIVKIKNQNTIFHIIDIEYDTVFNNIIINYINN
jgi:hypothetical protein